jgi:hypothetical protein
MSLKTSIRATLCGQNSNQQTRITIGNKPKKEGIHGYSVGNREDFEINSEQFRFQQEKLHLKEGIE